MYEIVSTVDDHIGDDDEEEKKNRNSRRDEVSFEMLEVWYQHSVRAQERLRRLRDASERLLASFPENEAAKLVSLFCKDGTKRIAKLETDIRDAKMNAMQRMLSEGDFDATIERDSTVSFSGSLWREAYSFCSLVEAPKLETATSHREFDAGAQILRGEEEEEEDPLMTGIPVSRRWAYFVSATEKLGRCRLETFPFFSRLNELRCDVRSPPGTDNTGDEVRRSMETMWEKYLIEGCPSPSIARAIGDPIGDHDHDYGEGRSDPFAICLVACGDDLRGCWGIAADHVYAAFEAFEGLWRHFPPFPRFLPFV